MKERDGGKVRLHRTLDMGRRGPLPRKRIQIEDWVRREIVRGGLKPGDALPSREWFRTRFTPNLNMVQRAFDELRREGSSAAMRTGLATGKSAPGFSPSRIRSMTLPSQSRTVIKLGESEMRTLCGTIIAWAERMLCRPVRVDFVVGEPDFGKINPNGLTDNGGN